MNFRQGLVSGALGAAVAAAVAAQRVPERGVAFLVSFGGGALFFGLALGGLAVARPLAAPLRGVLLGLGLAALPLAKLAAVLKVATHHRPLGAVTFAVLAAALCLVAIAFATRAFAASEPERSPTSRFVRWALLALALVGPVFLLARGAVSPDLRLGVFDVALGLGTGALLGLVPWPASTLRAVEAAALPVWAGVVAAGILTGFVAGWGPAQLSSPALSAPITWMLR